MEAEAEGQKTKISGASNDLWHFTSPRRKSKSIDIRQPGCHFSPTSRDTEFNEICGPYAPPGILCTSPFSGLPTPNASPPNRSSFLSPSKPTYSDRFVPSRAGNSWQLTFGTPPGKSSGSPSPKPKTPHKDEKRRSSSSSSPLYSCLLMNEVLGYEHEDKKKAFDSVKSEKVARRLFHYDSSEQVKKKDSTPSYFSSPLSSKSVKLAHSTNPIRRKIATTPFRVLDAPELQDDFYLNLISWSSQNVLAVALASKVHMLAPGSKVIQLCDVADHNSTNTVTSVEFNERGNLIAVGTLIGTTLIYDVSACKPILVYKHHTARVGSLAWNGFTLCSGSRDRTIFRKDLRSPGVPEFTLAKHRQEVCGLKWSPDKQCLASGGNDNIVFIWNMQSDIPLQKYEDHSAAVKALAWSPHDHGLLATGGGTADKTIRFRNTLNAQTIKVVDTGTQVCNLAWSKFSPELVSTHGYSHNGIIVWEYPSLRRLATLTGHSMRVLHFAMSPYGEEIATGSGDETIRFWKVFKKTMEKPGTGSLLHLFNGIR